MIVTIIGSLFKLIHFWMPNLMLTLGTGLEVLAGILLLIKLLNNKNSWNGWLDS
jgi:hypothetical protein